MKSPLLACLFCSSLAVFAPCNLRADTKAPAEPIVVDAVVATIDNKPITLSDLGKSMVPARALTLKEASQNHEAQAALDKLIFNELIKAEAQAKKVAATQEDIEQYVSEVARRNNLSREDFEKALASENRSMKEYLETVTIDILRGKLASAYLKSSTGVSKKEIDEYLKNNPSLVKSGSQVKLRQIVVRTDNRSEDEAQQMVQKIEARLKDGDDFEDVAEELSEGAEAKEGGLIGLFADEDLSPTIFDAIFQLKDGEYSAAVKSDDGYHFFMVEERVIDKEKKDDAVMEKVKHELQGRKAEAKVNSYFMTELYKLHTVDKKI